MVVDVLRLGRLLFSHLVFSVRFVGIVRSLGVDASVSSGAEAPASPPPSTVTPWSSSSSTAGSRSVTSASVSSDIGPETSVA
ncbi:hypothetical protein GJR96_07435 [Haloferax sp. MBLA0076]|uniref:Uncharacterized protein n=1 Tax=Haloferax litoreum TaxID=2666140 RepID=A0A6A8GI35_9EURY|nr:MULTISPECIES: hypothetical protein [Haloferax]MRX21787.1 hypothetical protein [Haloferax litoreum]